MQDYINGYATALYEIAKVNNKKIVSFKNELLMIMISLEENIGFINILNSSSLNNKEKEKLIVKTFGKLINSEIINFLSIISIRKKSHLLIRIINKFIEKTNYHLEIKNGIIYSVDKLDNKTINDIESKLTKDSMCRW